MLYQRWLETVRATGPQTALTDMAAGRSWTFQALANEAERGAPASEPVLFADATGAGFILAVLRAWRAGRILCPLEPGQLPPGLTTGLPAGIAHLKFTSASTGTPRVVALTGAQMAADADNIVASMGLRPDWPNIGVISLAHSYGFSNLVLPLLLHGIPLILAEAALPEALRRAAANQSCVTLAAVPALWRAWLEAGSIPPNIKLAISAGAPLPLPLEVAVFDRHRLKIHNFYGSSETGGIAFDGSAEPRTDAAFVGSPMANVQVALAEDGCVEVRGPAVAETYWPDPSPDLGEGRFKTSDLGELLDGGVFLRGRASDQINVAGRKLSPEQVERVLSAHPAVRACLVFGVPSSEQQRGEIPVACIAATETVAAETLRQFLARQLPSWQVPKDWWFVPALESSSRGKLSRAEWRAKYLIRNVE